MQVKCFGCDALLEGDDADAVAHAFVADGQDRHAWSYPEEAIRNYARNYAEATERLTGGTERLSEIAAVTVHPVTEDRIDDWLRLFDRDAFAGNPDWASCHCLEPHVPATPELPERAWRDTRATVARRLRSGATSGYLAYVDGRPVGWVNVLRHDTLAVSRHSTETPIRRRLPRRHSKSAKKSEQPNGCIRAHFAFTAE